MQDRDADCREYWRVIPVVNIFIILNYIMVKRRNGIVKRRGPVKNRHRPKPRKNPRGPVRSTAKVLTRGVSKLRKEVKHLRKRVVAGLRGKGRK